MKTRTTALHRAFPPMMLASLIASSGLLPAQTAANGPATSAAPALPPFTEAVRVDAKAGKIDSPLFSVFGSVTVPGIPKIIDADGMISVRSYALGDIKKGQDTPPSIPGPTFVFKPGDLLRLRFYNFLNRSKDPDLNAFQNNPQQTGPAASDDTDEHVSHEISIPNDSNVTNLHVHGLHVDPKQDDVTLLVLPEDNDPGSLTPDLQRFVPTINRWWTRNYQYKLPADHLPGTYWYHSHKHGSTSSQVENGMAGTLVIQPKNEKDEIVPGLWKSGHDRVMMLQELANYSTDAIAKKQARGKGQGQAPNLNTPVVTINGVYQPTLKLAPGQIERWRFIVAGANHTTSSYIWVGSITPAEIPSDTRAALLAINNANDANAYTNPPQGVTQKFLPSASTFTCTPMPGRVKLVAVDGITVWQSRDITPTTPAFGSAGNRLDLLVQCASAPTTGGYRIYQNYPVTQQDLAEKHPNLFGEAVDPAAVKARLLVLGTTSLQSGSPAAVFQTPDATPIPLANNLPTDPFSLGTNYQGFTQTWADVNADGSIKSSTNSYPIVPLLRGRSTGNKGVEIDPNFPQKFGVGEIGWQPLPDAGGGAPVSANILVNLDIGGNPDGPTEFPKDIDARLSALSPAGKGSRLQRVDPISQQLEPGIPSYVSPIPDAAIAGAQVAVFDRGQFTFSYVNKSTQTQVDVRQFWINGRQFSVDDWIGNPASGALIKQPLKDLEPSLGAYSASLAHNTWTHQKNEGIFITNPGYFTPIAQVAGSKNSPVYNYDYAKAKPITYQAVTGLKEPHTPVSTTAEEWLLVNNSDLFHPFHIHINPFFVTEVGQLNYSASAGWSLGSIKWAGPQKQPVQTGAKSPFDWVVGNWWDVITIPPHGYVRFRMWVNVPTQTPVDHGNLDSDLVVHDNANLYGSWVFHCHILRHEDRGMMLMVNTEPKGVDLDGTWTQDGGTIRYAIEDEHGGLAITPSGATSPANFTRGTFNRGVGNALFSQPFLGSMKDTSAPASPGAPAISAFCVVNDPKLPTPVRMLLSNGHFLSRSGPAGDAQIAATNRDLSGDWVDVENRVVTIKQQPSASTKGQANLTFTPKTPVWWSIGKGTWVPSPQIVPPATTPPPVAYTGTQVLENNTKQNQLLTFCISLDLKTLVFSNGITWTRKSN